MFVRLYLVHTSPAKFYTVGVSCLGTAYVLTCGLSIICRYHGVHPSEDQECPF